MNFADWEPVYELVLADLGYDRAADERARDVLAGMVEPFDADRLAWLADATVAVAGAGPSLTEPAALERAAAADRVVAASTAADRLRDAGVDVDLLVTDLDKNPETAVELTRAGTPVAVHAHGDNVPALRGWVPACDGDHVLPTTQAAPRGPVVDYGGFTDGDRAAFLADAFDAATLRFVGWDLDDPTVGPEKRRKLAWAERLLRWLEYRRGDRFDLFDAERGRGPDGGSDA
ncbi:MAG: 6-hydroxymethylpterin diphosphokinase MptE-like protein [Haloferacaceae archaeon]